MGKVTYLLGAGASFNCLPLVNGIPAAIDKLRQDIVHLVHRFNQVLILTPKNYL